MKNETNQKIERKFNESKLYKSKRVECVCISALDKTKQNYDPTKKKQNKNERIPFSKL